MMPSVAIISMVRPPMRSAMTAEIGMVRPKKSTPTICMIRYSPRVNSSALVAQFEREYRHQIEYQKGRGGAERAEHELARVLRARTVMNGTRTCSPRASARWNSGVSTSCSRTYSPTATSTVLAEKRQAPAPGGELRVAKDAC